MTYTTKYTQDDARLNRGRVADCKVGSFVWHVKFVPMQMVNSCERMNSCPKFLLANFVELFDQI